MLQHDAVAPCPNAKKWVVCLALVFTTASLTIMEQRAMLRAPWALFYGQRNEPASATSFMTRAIPTNTTRRDEAPPTSPPPLETPRPPRPFTDRRKPPKPCEMSTTDNALLVSSDVPRSMATLPAMTGVLDPSPLSRPVYLPWRQENWCPVSPCLTVANATQRVTEVPHFEGWLKAVRQNWTDPFDPLLFQHEGPMYWYVPTQTNSSTFYMRNATHGFAYMDAIAPLDGGIRSSTASGGCEHWVNASGTILLWHNFHLGNYGHFIHDHVPSIVALLEVLGSAVSWVALPYSQLSEDWLCWFDPALLERVIFYAPGKVICSSAAAATLTPLSRRGEGGARWRSPATISLLNQKAHELHASRVSVATDGDAPARRKVVFASRNSATVLHGRALVNEQEVLASVRRMMQRHNRSEELVVYNGEGVSYADQFTLFSSASVIMGPHGSAMSNVLWSRSDRGCRDPVHVVEFVGSRISGPRVQRVYHGYYYIEASVPWVDYHMVTFHDNSTREHTSVSTDDVEAVLSRIWGGRRKEEDAADRAGGATTCYPGLRRR